MNPLCCIAPVSLDPIPNTGTSASMNVSPNPNPNPNPCAVPDPVDEKEGRRLEGLVYKWVNYGKGWRERWMVMQDGVLAYYKLRGPAKIAVGAVDGFRGRVVIGEESCKYLRKRSCNGGRSFGQCKPFGEVHLKVGDVFLSYECFSFNFISLI